MKYEKKEMSLSIASKESHDGAFLRQILATICINLSLRNPWNNLNFEALIINLL